jgi:ABC-type bacteriocin/lantibiotic exporter with double-glycine peptidase domain
VGSGRASAPPHATVAATATSAANGAATLLLSCRLMSLLALTAAAATLAVPFVPQQKDTCGPAALAMVLGFWGDPASHDALARELDAAELRGVAGSRLADAARSRGMTAVAYAGDDAHLRAFVGRGRPLVVAWDMGRGRFHNVVVVGFEGDDVIVHDPAQGPSRRVAGKTFAERWAGAGRWTLLVMPAPP